MNFEIRKCNINDIEPYSNHAIYHLTEKGIGSIYVHPYSSLHKPNFSEFVSNLSKKWSADPFTPNWEIAWVAIVDNKFVGHLDLRCGGILKQLENIHELLSFKGFTNRLRLFILF